MNGDKLPKENIDLDNPDFQNVWKLVKYTRQSIFMTGKAGAGKSTFLRYITANTKKKHVVLAPTGIAAVNVGGVTLHSFFKIPFKPLTPDDPDFAINRIRRRIKYTKSHIKLIKELELIIIDEVSMVRADIIDFIDKILRVFSGNMREPFGGKQLLLVGDVFQLEPVVTADMRDVLKKYYSNFFFFSARAFADLEIIPIELRKIYRQQDTDFIAMLDRFRSGTPTGVDVQLLNQRVAPDYLPSDENFVMTLATRRDMVDHINQLHLDRLTTPEISYNGNIVDDFPESSLPAPLELTLKVGAQVVFVRNDRDKRWVNGTIGKIYEASSNNLVVELENGNRHVVEREVWENIRYEYDEETKTINEIVIGSFIQYPLRLAWALTIHKSQGLTFKNVIIDVGRGAFSGGQTYVALSRCTSLSGIILRSQVSMRDVFVNPAIISFSRMFNDATRVNTALESAEADDAYCKAMRAFDDGNYRGAVDEFAKAVSLRNELNRVEVRRLIALKLSEADKLKAQIVKLQEEIDADREVFARLAAEYISMGTDCLEEAGDITAALANFDKALFITPDNVKAYYLKGVALSRADMLDDALESFKKSLKIDNSFMAAAFEMTRIFTIRSQWHEALNTLLAIQATHPGEALIHQRLSHVYASIGDEDMAAYHQAEYKRLRKKHQ